MLTGCDTLEDGLQLQDDIIKLLERGGFHLRKWNSNNDRLLEVLPLHMRARQPQSIPGTSTCKTLGLTWNAQEDILQFQNRPQDHGRITKRSVLSHIATLFDPLGLLSPIVIRAKMFLQELWKSELNWDDELPAQLEDEWFQFKTCLQAVDTINIPRSVKTHSGGILDIHGFSDASERGYGAVIYIRHVVNDTINVNLLCSKSKVAPVKSVSLPRLELCGALLLAELMEQVKSSIKHNITRTVYWTDSSIVICWLASHASRWKTFVANRVAKIQDLTIPEAWRHIRSQDNPADLVSRGARVIELRQSDLWWNGPHWLRKDEGEWPTPPHKLEGVIVPEEKIVTKIVFSVVKEESISVRLINKCSTLTRLQRSMAYCLRFMHNSRFPHNKSTGPLKTEELELSLKQLIKIEQHKCLTGDLHSLRKNQQVCNKSKLITLKPIIDSDGIIRVGGRLENSHVTYNQKHPIILPAESHLTQLIINHEHIRQMHAGPQALLAAVRRQYWPLKARNLTRKIVHQCVQCFRARPKWTQPTMGNLPSSRTTPSRPFTNTGVDYCGPVYIKSGLMRNSKLIKGYISIFVCFATKAIHLELVSDLTTETFLAAFKRFISRRGICENVFSDNGTNFVGANNEIQELKTLLQDEHHRKKIIDSSSIHQTKWHFIPPNAPHFGGLWEAGVKSVKQHLRRVVGNANLTFEQFYTTLTQIEACLNSRPLTPISTDPMDPLPLTPGHFLTGEALTALPEPDLTDIAANRLSQWQRTQQLTQHFWKRWSTEYLAQLQQRPKWCSGTVNIQPGQLVLVKEDNLPPLKWVTARVKELHPGPDGHTRVATLQTTSGVMKRPVNKLCVLPSD